MSSPCFRRHWAIFANVALCSIVLLVIIGLKAIKKCVMFPSFILDKNSSDPLRSNDNTNNNPEVKYTLVPQA
jgi:hypothetical protein